MEQFEPIYHAESSPLSLWLAPNNAAPRADLARECRLRGLLVERDPSQHHAEIREHIAASQGLVLYITSTSVHTLQPLGVAITYLLQNPETPWWLVCDGISIEELYEHDLFKTLPFQNLTNAWNLEQSTPAQIAQSLLKIVFGRFIRQTKPTWLSLLAVSHHAAPTKGAHIALDWSDWTDDQAIQPEAWPAIQSALIDVRNALVEQAIERLLVLPRVHLTAALLLGAVLNARLAHPQQWWVANEFNGILQWWDTNAKGSAQVLKPQLSQLDQGQALSMEWAITQPVSAVSQPIQRYIDRQLSQQLKQRRLYAKADQQRFNVESGLSASALAHFFRSELLANPAPIVHLFAAMPAALAVCFGRQLNACPPVQCYELKGRDDYQPSWLIKA